MIRLTIDAKYSFEIKKSFAAKIVDIKNYNSKEISNVSIIKNEKKLKKLISYFGEIVITDESADFEIDEVLLFYKDAKKIRRFFRPRANANAILLTEQCDQRCIMCSQPPKNKRYDDFPLFNEAILLCPKNAVLTITGGEPTLLIEDLLNFLIFANEKRPDIFFHILSNGQHFTKEHLNQLSIISESVLWGIPLYSHDSKEHDNIVSKDGAYERLFISFDLLLQAGSRVELRTVLMRQNIKSLVKLAELINHQLPWIEIWALMQMEYIGYAKMNWHKIFYDNSEDFSFLQNSIIYSLSNRINLYLYNFPLCTVPKKFRSIAKPSISDWKKKFIDKCEGCKKTNICAGFFEWHKNEIGYKNIGKEYL